MHGLVAGLWSSLSGAGRFISRSFSGFFVDTIGFEATAGIVTGMQLFVAAITLLYLVCCECRPARKVHWEDEATVVCGEGKEDGEITLAKGSRSD